MLSSERGHRPQSTSGYRKLPKDLHAWIKKTWYDRSMSGIIVVGAQWGDEGKGKIVDVLTGRADWVVRFQGGNNAGHTIVVDGAKTILSLLPSGILREDVKCLLSGGVVLNPSVIISEIERVSAAGVTINPSRLYIDEDAHLILDYHVAIDKERERVKGEGKIGTTGRGIGPAYEDRAQRTGIRCGELRDLKALKGKVEQHVEEKNKILKYVLGSDIQVDLNQVWGRLQEEAKILVPYLCAGSRALFDALSQGQRVVFEGAQGVLLDTTFGTYPFVTSSSTIASAALTGCGLGPKMVDFVLGVAKAYTTRVGSGPFPSEIDSPIGDEIRARGHEFGSVTGRPRRCGWFDVVAMKRAVRTSGIESLVLTKLDVLTGLGPLKVCTGYEKNGAPLEDLPSSVSECEGIVPKFMEFAGWEEDLSHARSWGDLPTNARKYIEGLATLVGCPIGVVSVGAGREATMVVDLPPVVRDFIAVS